ncbi:MAG: hypothetical protein IJ632_01885 [Muribaculaceae bacterium]|nr:hypothetical protein [Muribaculaceae bacterium]
MRKAALFLAIVSAMGIMAQQSGYRTAIVLKSGVQEIVPDSALHRISVGKLPAGGHSVGVELNDGSSRTFTTADIEEINYGPLTAYERWTGDWYLVASPNGEANEVGIMISQVVSMPVHAVLPSPSSPDYGSWIYCTVDSIPHRGGLHYNAQFKLRYNADADGRQGTIALVLDDRQPVNGIEYAGGPETYAYFDKNSTYYFGVSDSHAGGDTGHRYQYWLGNNIETQMLEGMELSTSWTEADLADPESQFKFAREHQIYWVTALDIPFDYAENDMVGVVDIFSSARLMRRPWIDQ